MDGVPSPGGVCNRIYYQADEFIEIYAQGITARPLLLKIKVIASRTRAPVGRLTSGWRRLRGLRNHPDSPRSFDPRYDGYIGQEYIPLHPENPLASLAQGYRICNV
jgi:hypothetical protein